MSKGFEEKNEQKLNSKSLPSMSSRQQILYLMKETQNVSNKEDDADSGREVLDYLSYFMKRKEKIVSITLIYLLNSALPYPGTFS